MLSNPDKMQESKPLPSCIFYTVREACFLLGVAPSTIYSLHHAGKLTIRKIGTIGKKSVILKSDIDEYVANAAMPRGVERKNGVGKYHPNKKAKAAAPAAPNGSGGA